MDEKRAETVFPSYWRGVRRYRVKRPEKMSLCAFDTETFFGKVFALGFYGNGAFKISYGLNGKHLDFLLDSLFSFGARNSTVVCGAHYLVFDLGVLFWETLNPLDSRTSRAPRRSFFSLLKCKTEIEIIWSKPCFAKFRRDGKTIHLIDTFAFFTMSLSRGLTLIGASVSKKEKPKDLGKRLIPKKELTPYLQADVAGCYELLNEIKNLHSRYDLRLCVSLPQMSGRIFRHFYLKSDFEVPPSSLINGALLSYHGGKNSFVAKPGWHKDCYDLDINSAYPEAMAQLPNFEKGKWVYGEGMDFFRRHPHGIYMASGKAKTCPYGVIFDHGFKKITGEFSGVWATGYEISESLRTNEVVYDSLRGYGYRENAKTPGAFGSFVRDFYRRKQSAKTKTEGHFYKLILNSLYGKFIQRTEDDDGNFVAGSMFDPTIASLITGYVRAKIHSLEHRYNAIHTATDGFITKTKPNPRDIGAEIGQLKAETFGPCLILRNKLYLHFDNNGQLKKSGLHGFEGDPTTLEKLWKSSKRIYKISRLVKWAESWHIGLPPGTELIRNKILTIPPYNRNN